MLLTLSILITLLITFIISLFHNIKLNNSNVIGSSELTMDDFPYLHKIITLDELKARAEKLPTALDKIITESNDKYTPITAVNKCVLGDKLNGQYLRFLSEWHDTEDYDELALYFTENQLVKCYTAKHKSLEDNFTKLGKKLANDLRRKNANYTPLEFRNYIFQNIKFCHNFRCSLAAKIYQYFDAKSVIDFSSGWGDRLFAACAMKIKYLGIDPNISLQPGYANIADALDSANKVIPSGAEYLPNERFASEMQELSLESFDMLFTSPPYYDYEIYSKGPQSIDLYKHSYEKWLIFFLCYTIGKYSKYVNKYIVIYMQDVDQKIYLEPIIMFLQLTQPFKYVGVFSSNRFPAIVFERSSSSTNPLQKLEDKFKRYYPKIYDEYIALQKIGVDNPGFEIGSQYDAEKRILTDIGKNSSIMRAELRKVINDDYMQCLLESIKEMLQYHNINITGNYVIIMETKNDQYEECLGKLHGKQGIFIITRNLLMPGLRIILE